MRGNLPSTPLEDSISSTLESQDVSNMEPMGELSLKFCQQHYLSGLVLSELAYVLEGQSTNLWEQAIALLRDLLASHDSDSRYNSREAHTRIACIYMPLLSVVMDNYQVGAGGMACGHCRLDFCVAGTFFLMMQKPEFFL